MGRSPARFRISIKDNKTGRTLKVELIDAPGLWGERRFRIRQNDKTPERVVDVTLTEVFARLRSWLVRQT